MPVSAISVLRVLSATLSLLLRKLLERRGGPKLAEFKIFRFTVSKPRNPHLKTDGAHDSDDSQSQALNIYYKS